MSEENDGGYDEKPKEFLARILSDEFHNAIFDMPDRLALEIVDRLSA